MFRKYVWGKSMGENIPDCQGGSNVTLKKKAYKRQRLSVRHACVVRQSKSLGSPVEVVRRRPKTRRRGHVSEAWSRGMSCDLGPPFRELVWLWPR